MKVLIGCECSGVVREAFRLLGHDAWSCDLKDTDVPGQHIRGDVLQVLDQGWDLGIFHPECCYLCWSAERFIKEQPGRMALRIEAFEFFKACYNAPIGRIAVENSLSWFLNRNYRFPDQTFHPYHFGDPFKKTTCLWLRGLPYLWPTNILPIGHRYPKSYRDGTAKGRSERRAKTYPGIAQAMAEQWGRL